MGGEPQRAVAVRSGAPLLHHLVEQPLDRLAVQADVREHVSEHVGQHVAVGQAAAVERQAELEFVERARRAILQ